MQFDGYESPFPGIVEFVTGGPVVLATTYDSAPLLSSDAISWELAGGMRPLPSFRSLHAGAEGVVGLYSESAGPYPWLGTSRSVTISKDGIRWKRYSTGRLNFKDVAWRDGLFVAVGWKLFSTESIFVSGDGESWTPAVSGVPPEENGLAAVAAGPPGFVAVGGHHGVLFSADGVTWQGTQISGGGFDDVVWSVDWAGDRFVVTARDSIATSADGLAWKVAEINGVPLSFAGNGERIVGVGSDGLVLLSLNGGSTWMTLDAGTTDDLVGVIWDGSEFAAVSADGLFLTSPDGMTWTSEEIGGSIFPSALGHVDGGPVVVGWDGAVALRDCPPRSVGAVSDRALVVSGANGTAWRSDLALANPGAEPIRADLWLLGETGVGGDEGPTSLIVAPGYATPLHDVVGDWFEGERSAGAVLIDPDGPLEVTSRTYTVAGGGSFGQNVPALGSLDTVTGSEQVVLPGLAETAGYRSNLGLVNLNGEELTVRVEMRAADGSVLGEREYALPPYGWRQIARVLREVAGDPVPLASAVLSGSGQDVAFAAYASVIDNASGDPVMTIPMAAVGEPIAFPAAAHTSGYGGVAWRTDLDVVNPGIEAAAYHLELLPGDGGGVAASPTFTLAPGAAVRYQDLLGTVFGVSGAGGVRVVPESGGHQPYLRRRRRGELRPGGPGLSRIEDGVRIGLRDARRPLLVARRRCRVPHQHRRRQPQRGGPHAAHRPVRRRWPAPGRKGPGGAGPRLRPDRPRVPRRRGHSGRGRLRRRRLGRRTWGAPRLRLGYRQPHRRPDPHPRRRPRRLHRSNSLTPPGTPGEGPSRRDVPTWPSCRRVHPRPQQEGCEI